MPTVFVYEFITAHRLGADPGSALHSLFVEGRAMREAISADFATVPGVTVLPFPENVPDAQHSTAFRDQAKAADFTFVIAPETGGELEHLAREVQKAGGTLLGSTPDAIALTTDKLQLFRHWAKHRVPQVPTLPADHRPVVYPSVLKPRDGAGSEDMHLLNSLAEYEDAVRLTTGTGSKILQPYWPGVACSVAVLIGAKQRLALCPTQQRLSADGKFHYEGGQLPLAPSLAERATRLALQASNCVRGLSGFIGVDLILAEPADGSRDAAVEINPRLTTSYVGLRAATDANLAGLVLALANGETVNPPEWKAGTTTWSAAGIILPA